MGWGEVRGRGLGRLNGEGAEKSVFVVLGCVRWEVRGIERGVESRETEHAGERWQYEGCLW